MVCGTAGRWAKIHDIYISVILKHFLGNRIECELIFPFPAPFSLLVDRFAVVSPYRLGVSRGEKIASMIKQSIVLTIMRSIV